MSSRSDRMAIFMNDKATADVAFLVGEESSEIRETVTAHKNILAVNSEVFRGMFYGSIPLQQPVEVVDCSPAAFKLMLRYIYLDEISQLSDINDLMSLIYLANKYMLHELTKRAAEVLLTELNPSDVCAVLPLLCLLQDDEAKGFWEYAELHGEEVVKSDRFLELTATELDRLLSRPLKASPMLLYNRAIEWGAHHCQKNSLDPSAANVRAAVGEAFDKIDFSTMALHRFSGGPAKDDYLSAQKKIDTFIGLVEKAPPVCYWTCTRYTHTRETNSGWVRNHEKISFFTDKGIKLFGVGIYGPSDHQTQCNVTVELSIGSSVVRTKEATLKFAWYCPQRVLFDNPVELSANTTATMSLDVSGETFLGREGRATVMCEGDNGIVTFTFSEPANGGWTCTFSGQIPEIYFA